MPKLKLNSAFIDNFPRPDKRLELYDELVDGLFVRITKNGTKTFGLAYGTEGKRYTIGRFKAISLSDARKIARQLKARIALGEDPQAQKVAEKYAPKKITFKELAMEFEEKHMRNLREKTKNEYKRIINVELVPVLGKKVAEEIHRRDVIRLLDNVAIVRGKETMANRIRARLHSIFEFGISRSLVESNPVRSTPQYSGGNRRKDRYYNKQEIHALWKAFEEQDEPARSVFKILLLTGQRSKETRHMRWNDIQGDIWVIPKELSKSGREHHVPLSSLAIEILEERKLHAGDSEWVFESPTNPGNPLLSLKRPKGNIRRVSKINDDQTVKDFTPHDLRRTAATFMAKLGVDRTTLGKVLNHKGLSGDGLVTGIYDRHSYMGEKRDALENWALHLEKIIHGETTNIIKIA
jgi:integrase